MQIIIDGKEAVIKKGSSFDFIAENRLFSGSDSYTLSITFPIRDCQQNLDIFGHINRSELPVDDYIFDCEIRDGSFSRFGTLTIVEISDIDVKAQFLEGRAEQNFAKDFDETYVKELDLGSFPSYTPSQLTPEDAWNPATTNWEAVALPWVSADSGISHNFAEYSEEDSKYSWCEDVRVLSWQPYLLHIVKKICEAVGYSYDLTDWDDDTFLSQLLICNTLPDAWEISGYARALPHWTVDEFFEKLELFMRGEFTIDHRQKKISFKFSKTIMESADPVMLDKVVDEYSSSIDTEGGNCQYLETKAFKYSDHSLAIWKYQCCDWFFKNLKEDQIERYETSYDMNQAVNSLLTYNDAGGNHRHPSGSKSLASEVLYVSDIDLHFMLRNISRTENGKDATGRMTYIYKRKLQAINEFGAYVPSGANLDDAEELEFVPVCIDFTEDKFGDVMFLEFSSYNESGSNQTSSGVAVDILTSFDENEFQKTGLQRMIETGEKESPAEYYDVVNLGNYWGYYKSGTLPYPLASSLYFNAIYEKSLRINDGSNPRWTVFHNIDRTRKVTFKFLADDIPNPRAVFYIRGRRYICEKITATFSEDGMSQLLKGEFWPLID